MLVTEICKKLDTLNGDALKQFVVKVVVAIDRELASLNLITKGEFIHEFENRDKKTWPRRPCTFYTKNTKTALLQMAFRRADTDKGYEYWVDIADKYATSGPTLNMEETEVKKTKICL